MKVKASPRSSKVVVEMEARGADLPPIPVPEVALKKILVPVDFSPLSRKALDYGVSFARQFHAEISLLHVVEPMPLPPEMPLPASGASYQMDLQQFAEQQLQEWQNEVAGRAAIKTAVRYGNPFREIVQAANENNIDLIIIGTHGRTGLPHLLVGGTAERIVRLAPCPVMVVREREKDFLA